MIPNEFNISINVSYNTQSIYSNSIDLSYLTNISVDIQKISYPLSIEISSFILNVSHDERYNLSGLFSLSSNDSEYSLTSDLDYVSISDSYKSLDGNINWNASIQGESSQLILRFAINPDTLLMSSDIWLTY